MSGNIWGEGSSGGALEVMVVVTGGGYGADLQYA